MRRVALTSALSVLLGACSTEFLQEFNTCTLDVALPVVQAQPGDVIDAASTPLSPDVWDNRVTVGGVTAEVLAASRTNCTSCDTCKIDESCLTCETCEALWHRT